MKTRIAGQQIPRRGSSNTFRFCSPTQGHQVGHQVMTSQHSRRPQSTVRVTKNPERLWGMAQCCYIQQPLRSSHMICVNPNIKCRSTLPFFSLTRALAQSQGSPGYYGQPAKWWMYQPNHRGFLQKILEDTSEKLHTNEFSATAFSFDFPASSGFSINSMTNLEKPFLSPCSCMGTPSHMSSSFQFTSRVKTRAQTWSIFGFV